MRAILQVADTGPLESLAYMLRAVGVEPMLPDLRLRRLLRDLGCDTVLEIDDLVRSGSYERPFKMPSAGPEAMDGAVYVDVKGHRNFARVRAKWPKQKVLWYRINGGKPEVVPGCGDEVNPPCPVLTPNQWYARPARVTTAVEWADDVEWQTLYKDKAYACWPPFVRFDNYAAARDPVDSPMCLVHNLTGWGYGQLIQSMRNLGVKMYGAGSPDGPVLHKQVPARLSRAQAYVHLKSSDAPGYALYEAMAAACPVVCTRRLIWRCRMEALLVPGETCLVFDRETHDGLTYEDVRSCAAEVAGHLVKLQDLEYSKRIGEAGRAKLKAVVWQPARDGDSLRAFWERNFA